MKTNWNKYSKIGLSDTDPIIEMAVRLTAHAADRAVIRDGKPVGLTKDTIQQIVDKAEDKILQVGQKSPTVIIKTADAINIVGSLAQQAGEWIFNVITVIVKKNFVPKNAWDKIVYINERKTRPSLISIINRIENQRIQKINHLQEMKVGSKVQYNGQLGLVAEVSPKQTSIIVEFADKTRKRFFMNKRKNRETLDNLSLQKIFESMASDQAHKIGLQSAGWGRWKDQSGKITYKTKNDRLVPLKQSEPSKTKRMSKKSVISFKDALKKVDSFEDRLGEKVDNKIKPTLAAFIVNGFNTVQSCEGHSKEGHQTAPYVDIDNNIEKAKKMLDAFNKSRKVSDEYKLNLLLYYTTDKTMRGRITPTKAKFGGGLASDEKTRAKELVVFQKEMNDFTNFLKANV